jgi:hypothetical protein
MTDYTTEQVETIRAVVDRVSSYQDGATEGTVETELREGFDEAGVDVSARHIEALVSQINQDGDPVPLEDLLSA